MQKIDGESTQSQLTVNQWRKNAMAKRIFERSINVCSVCVCE